jgi:hypothetical protein
MSAVANNDNGATTFSALVLWQSAALLQEVARSGIRKRSLLLGVLLGLGLLSKASLIALMPVAALAIMVSSARWQASNGSQREARGERPAPGATLAGFRFVPPAIFAAGNLLLAFGVAALIAGWYFVRNWVLYGDPLGWTFTLQVSALREGPLTPQVLVWLLKGVFRSFWLGWIGIQFDAWIYWLIALLCLVGGAGFVVWLVRRWRGLDAARCWTLALLGLHAAVTLGSLLRWTATVLGTDQGRLIYPILPTVMLILVVGWAWWVRGRALPWVLGGLVAGMLILAIVTPIRYIGPVHAPAPQATEAELAAAVPLDVDFDGVRLLAYSLESAQVRAGEKLVLDLYWMGLEPQDRDVLALIQLVDEEGKFLMYADGSPTAGRDTTDRWTPGVALASRHLLPVPPNGRAGVYRLTVGLHPFAESDWLSVTRPDGTSLGDHIVLPVEVIVLAP